MLQMSFYGVEEYSDWLVNAGFNPLRVEFVKKNMKHDGKEGLNRWFGSTWLPFLSCPQDNHFGRTEIGYW
ncbi:hypothetical protein [Desulfofarcimen acetoxidans]|uniref:hypothetical protein n=1 Tax=Desulfofarcimen acetoxidans TaxID=58138 RepID=UPI0012FEF1DC|nr:hypothetical protein [Desulfofarcimen acetoxidans]